MNDLAGYAILTVAMAPRPRILITGAAGNLGSFLARHLTTRDCDLRLMYHRKPLPVDLARAPNAVPVQADLAKLETALFLNPDEQTPVIPRLRSG
jgi:nucleoside-diphosphate-sugar epimerase